MKNLVKIFFVITCIFLIQCEKKPFDYRNKYVGEYEFSILIHVRDFYCCENNLPCCLNKINLTYRGEVTYGLEKDEIIIHYIGNEYKHDYNALSWKTKNGKLNTVTQNNGSIQGLYNGAFNNNEEVEFRLVFGKTGLVVHEVKGKRL